MAIYMVSAFGRIYHIMSKFYPAILFTSFSWICIKSFHFSIPYDFFSLHSNSDLCHSSFSLVSSRLISQPDI